jgi:hypothetical protein
MAVPSKYQAKEVLNKVLNAGEDALNVDLSDSVTVTVDSEFPAAAALQDDSSNPTTTSVGSHLLGYDSGNTNWNRVEVDDVGHLQIDVVSSALPSGGATAANQATIIGHVDGIETLITSTNSKIDTFDAVLDAIKTDTQEIEEAVETIEGAVSGSEMQVDVVASLPAGTAAIGKLAANTGVDIGDVDVTSVVPGVAATNLGKAIQSAQGSTDTGVAALAVRNDALADLSGADGDYTPLQVNKTGALNVTENTGYLGAIFEDGDTNITSKKVVAIQFLEDTTFTTLTPEDSSYIGTASGNGDAIDTSNTFPQGMTIFGRWTGFRLASGTIVAYQGDW